MADVVDFALQGAGDEAKPPRRRADWAGLAGGGLILAGIAAGILYTVLVYQTPIDRAVQVAYLLGIAVDPGLLVISAGLVVAGSWPTAAPDWSDSRSRRRVCGGLLGVSLCALYLVQALQGLGNLIIGPYAADPYFLLGEAWWLPVAAGSGFALLRKGGLASIGRPGRPRRADALPIALLAIITAGVLPAWMPAWVQYTFTGSTGPHSTEFTNVFDGTWADMAGSIGEMAVFVAMAAAAALWRPARFGAVLLTTWVAFLAVQVILGIAMVIQTPPLAAFGVSPAARMTLTVAGTPWLWVGTGCTAALVVVYEWLLIRSRPRPRLAAGPVTWMEPAPLGPAEAPPLPLPRSRTGEAAFVRENVIGTPYSGEL